MKRFTCAILVTLSFVSLSAFAQGSPEGVCEVDVRVNDSQVDHRLLEMNRSEDQHWFQGTIEGVKLGLTVVEKGDGKLQIDAADAVSGKALIGPATIPFRNGEVRTQVTRGNVILDIVCR